MSSGLSLPRETARWYNPGIARRRSSMGSIWTSRRSRRPAPRVGRHRRHSIRAARSAAIGTGQPSVLARPRAPTHDRYRDSSAHRSTRSTMTSATEVASVVVGDRGHRLRGRWEGTDGANRFLDHLESRRFSRATIRAYAYDVVCLARFLAERSIKLEDVVATDLFDWINWQSRSRPPARPSQPLSIHNAVSR
jgi:hypothetical protein